MIVETNTNNKIPGHHGNKYRGYCILGWAGIAQSVQRLTTGWTVRGSNPDGGEIFHTCPEQPWHPPSFLYNAYRIFPVCVRVCVRVHVRVCVCVSE
jgi:hypothetical protein